jgi:hypothetical protein
LDKLAENGEEFDAKTYQKIHFAFVLLTQKSFSRIFGALTVDVIAKSAFGIDYNVQNNHNCQFYRAAREIFDFRFGDPRMFLSGLS